MALLQLVNIWKSQMSNEIESFPVWHLKIKFFYYFITFFKWYNKHYFCVCPIIFLDNWVSSVYFANEKEI